VKKLSVLLFAVLTIGVSLYSQEAYLELLRADLKAEHVAIVTENMELTDARARFLAGLPEIRR